MLSDKIVTNCTHNGECSRCGGCCTPLLPITFKEYNVIKEYISKNNISRQPFQEGNDIYLTCPFLNRHKKCCTIYSVRPEVCRNFSCVHQMKRINKDRFYYDKRADINGNNLGRFIPMDLLFYNDPRIALIYMQNILGDDASLDNCIKLLNKLCKDVPDYLPSTKDIAKAIESGDIRLEFDE